MFESDIFTIILVLVSIWSMVGSLGFWIHHSLFERSVKKKNSIWRIIVFLLLSGPAVWVVGSFLILCHLYKLFVYWLLQTEPIEIRKRNER